MREWPKLVLQLVLYVSVIVLMFALTRLVVVATTDAHETQTKVQQELDELNLTTRTVRVAISDKHDGLGPTLKETHDAVRQARTLIDVALKTSLQERESVAKTAAELTSLVGHADLLIQHADAQIDPMADSFLRVAVEAQQTLGESSKAMDAAAGLLSDPQIHATLANLASTSESASKMSADAQLKFHSMLFPPHQPWYQRTYNFALTGGKVAFDILTLKP